MAFGYDPAYSAFLRAMGVEEQTIRAGVRQQTNQIQRTFDRQRPVFQRRLQQGLEAVSANAEQRGVYRSGATVKNLVNVRTDLGTERAEQLAAMRDQLQSMQTGAATQVASLRRQAMEGELAGRTRSTERAAQAAYGQRGSYYR